MELELKQHKKLKHQQIDIQKGLTVLVGTNGSGKSSFLERLFFDNIIGSITNHNKLRSLLIWRKWIFFATLSKAFERTLSKILAATYHIKLVGSEGKAKAIVTATKTNEKWTVEKAHIIQKEKDMVVLKWGSWQAQPQNKR